MERRLDDIHARVSAPPKAQGGIGCLGVVLFLILFVRLGEVLDLVRALGQ